MRIAVILPAFNVAPFICNALLSVLGQSHPDWLLVVVDDGSTDATAELVAAYSDPRIILLSQQNCGVSAARNLGISHVRPFAPDAFLFLDGDDWLAPNALRILAASLAAAPNAVAAGGRYARVAVDGTQQLSHVPPRGDLLERLLTRNLFANGGHLLIRGDAVDVAGDFSPDLSYGEDWEYWARLALQGDFAAVRSTRPVLFVRERPGSVYLSKATDHTVYRAALEAIHQNPAIIRRVPRARLVYLRRRAETETAWAVGRELIRHGNRLDGRHWLERSLSNAPSLKRLALMTLSRLPVGPFRPYHLIG